MGDVGGDGGAVPHRLGSLRGGDVGERLEEGCAWVEVGALDAFEGFGQQEAEAGRRLR